MQIGASPSAEREGRCMSGRIGVAFETWSRRAAADRGTPKFPVIPCLSGNFRFGFRARNGDAEAVEKQANNRTITGPDNRTGTGPVSGQKPRESLDFFAHRIFARKSTKDVASGCRISSLRNPSHIRGYGRLRRTRRDSSAQAVRPARTGGSKEPYGKLSRIE